VSERERLYIEEKYYGYITGEIEKTTETLQTWARLYPDDFIPHNNLAINYKLLGRHEEALKESMEAVRLSPNTASARENLVSSFVALARFDEAEQAARELQRINPDSPGVHFSNYFFAFFRRDQAAMDREVQWARGKPEEAQLISYLAITAMYFSYWNLCEAMRVVQLPVLGPNYLRGYCYLQQRRGNEAIAEFKKIIDNPGIDPFSPARPLAHLGLARAAVVNGDTAGARKAYQDFFALWKDADQDLPVLVQARKEYEQLK
jgi:tetratricopeptide (TPR) repeat protein